MLLTKVAHQSFRVMSHDTGEWYRISRKPDLLFQKWQEFGEFWSENFQVSKFCTLIGPFCAKYITFDLKRYRGVIFHDTEVPRNIWRKTDLWFGKWHTRFSKFSPEHLEVSKLGFDVILLSKVENVWAKTLHRSYMQWHWRMTNNLKRNWLVVSKLT